MLVYTLLLLNVIREFLSTNNFWSKTWHVLDAQKPLNAFLLLKPLQTTLAADDSSAGVAAWPLARIEDESFCITRESEAAAGVNILSHDPHGPSF